MVCERKKPLTRPATAGESAVAGHPLPKGEGYISDLGTPGVQRKMWDMLSPMGEGNTCLPTAYCPLLTAHCLLPTAYCLLLTAYCLLPTAYCLLF